jgi:hypothetical protein
MRLPADRIDAAAQPALPEYQAEIVRYVQHAIEWKELSYTFFDQYDQQQDVSPLSPDYFSAFLRSGSARVIVPVFPAFSFGMLYFLKTGAIWSVEDRLAPCFADSTTPGPDQESVVYGLKKAFHGCVPGERLIDAWEVVVPTPMQILQQKRHF